MADQRKVDIDAHSVPARAAIQMGDYRIMVTMTFYVIFCLLTGLCGIQRRMGFFGTFVISLLITPVPVLVVLLLTGPSHGQKHHWLHFRNRPHN